MTWFSPKHRIASDIAPLDVFGLVMLMFGITVAFLSENRPAIMLGAFVIAAVGTVAKVWSTRMKMRYAESARAEQRKRYRATVLRRPIRPRTRNTQRA
jgi:uncharacterized membrane protein YqjE